MSAPLNVEASPLSPVQRARLRWCAPSGADVLVRLRLYAFGALDRPRLERAFEALRARHELLAMRVARLPEVEQPVQFVAAESEAVDAGLGATMSVSTFATGPGETAHRIEIALPWLLSDGPTLEILASELVEHYADAPEAPGALQFLDVAAWQEDLFESDEAAEARRFWSEVTPAQRRAPFPEGALEETGAPAACGPAITLSRTLEPGRVAALTAWADAHGLTPDACLHAAFSALLFRRAGTPVPVALRIEGRDAPELAGAAGALDRWVPVPTAPPEAPGGERLSEHALRLAQAEHEVRRWTDAFDGTGRDGERLGPYAAAFGAGPEPRGVIASPVTAGGVRFAFAGVDDGPLPAPLVLEASLEPASHPHSIVLTWRALHGSREAAELDALADQYAQLLASALSDDPPLESLVLSDTATALATIQVSALSPSRPVADRFAEQVALDPTAIALLDEAGAVSREELDRAANRIAAALQGAGVSPGDRVGVALPRSGAVIAGFLGIWRVGAAFVPLDPELPSRALRARADAGDLRVALVASDAADASRRSLPEEVTLVAVDPAAELPRDLSAPKAPTPAKELAYGIFTSGSTGTPKLVGIEHGALASYVGAVESRLGGEPGWSYATVSSFASDLGHTTIFTALASGGTLHVVGSERAMDPDRIAERFRAAPVDVLKIVPSHLAALLSGRDPAGVLPRRVLVLGGERLEPGLVDRVRALAPELRILNHYGPTETTVGVLTHEVAPTRTDASAPPLGAPLPGVTVEVVDGAGRVVPRGVPGELWIGGGQLARGYLGDEDQTAARFVEADRTIQGDGATRRYRTGDRAWMDALGRVHFGGRIDAQLKIRGIRIEPGEIERTLMAHPTVSDAAVRAFDGRLVGYLTGAGVEPDEVSRWLAERLPAAMVPERLVCLERLPLTANGKLDRRALPEPKSVVAEVPFVAPDGAAEQKLAEIFADVLGESRISATASFFELGGHSLLATRAVSRIREAFSTELPLAALFEEPTVRGLAPRLAEGEGAALPPLERVPRDGPLPVSFAQRRMWLLDRLEPEGRAAYAIPMAARVRGPLDVDAFSRSIDALVQRHETLRTVFATDASGEPVQVIQDARTAAPVRVASIDLRGLEGQEQQDAIAQELASRTLIPFDLAEGPLLRVALLQVGSEEHVLLAVCHHVIFDAWSRGVLLRELSLLYAALSHGAPIPLEPLEMQYADFAAWQRGWLSGERLEAERDYWRRALAGAPGLLSLPADRPRPSRPTHRGDRVLLRVPSETSQALSDLASREGATPFMVMLAAFQVLLGRLTGRDDLVVGSPIANRRQQDLEGLLGFFSNTVVLRTDLSGRPTFRDLLGRVRRTALDAYAHQDLPFEELVEILPVERDLSANPLFQVVFTLRNTPRDPVAFEGLSFEPVGAEVPTSKFDLTVLLEETEGGLLGNFEFATDLFERETVEGWRDAYVRLLDAIVADPDARVRDLPTGLPASLRPDPSERPGSAVRALRPDETLADRFHLRARQQPDAPAVGLAGESPVETSFLSYGELERRANQLARTLRERGVRAEDRVGLCAERGVHEWVGMLAAWKLGAAYVPLDPSFPEERLAWMVESSRVEWVMTAGAAAADALPAGVTTLALTDPANYAASSEPLDAPPGGAEGSAYVLYTSGSTGRPKGVAVSHRAAAFFLDAMTERLGWNADTRVLAVTTLSFDISLLERWGPLWRGGRSEVAPLEVVASGAALAECLAGSEATALQGTPATWRLLRDAAWQGGAALQALVGGEALPTELAAWIAARAGEVWNLYGPTETTVWSTAHRFEADASEAAKGTVELGTPLGATRLAVLDAEGRPAPVGVWGELAIGGGGVTRGYEGRGAETALRFVPDPFAPASEPGARLYRTGDLCRLRRDGGLEYGGRGDGQVKLRGFRIELGEIEAQLVADDAVAAAAVVPVDETLVAFVVAQDADSAPAVDGLRAGLAATLPAYMVPRRVQCLDALPLTPNGKIDRSALAGRVSADDGASPAFAAPRTETETALASIFAEVLGRDAVSVDASFFDLGGHSLLATRVAIRIREELGVEIPLRMLFEASTVAALAQAVDAGEVAGHEAGAPSAPIRVDERPARIPLSYAQERLWFLDQLNPGDASYAIPFALRLAGPLDVDALHAALQAVVDRHEVLRTTFAAVEGLPEQCVHPSGSELARVAASLAVVDASQEDLAQRDARARDLVFAAARQPFDLATGPLMRTTLVRLAPDVHVVALVTHHIVSDGWSAGVLARELTALYAAQTRGAPSPLAPLEIQYADWAIHERQVLDESALEREIAHWRRALAGVPQQLVAPDLEEPSRPAEASFEIDGAVLDRLEALARAHDASLFMVCLAAFQLLLGREGNTEDVVVGTDVAHRTHGATESLIGFFVNVLALRTRLDGAPSFAELVGRVRETCLEAYEHQDVPFARVAGAIGERREDGRSPLVQVLFVLQNLPSVAIELGDVRAEVLEPAEPTTKFDLALFFRRHGGGLAGTWRYDAGRFSPDRVERLARRLEALLATVAATPDVGIDALDLRTPAEREAERDRSGRRKAGRRSRLRRAAARPVATEAASPIEVGAAVEGLRPSDASAPLCIAATGTEADLVGWVRNERGVLEQALQQHGAVLLRGGPFHDEKAFEALGRAVVGELYGEYGDLPRSPVSGRVYGSTPYPPDRSILFHNESAHLTSWPTRIFFGCVIPAETRGETPVADGRAVLAALPDDVRERFETLGLRYSRTFTAGLDVRWQDFFRTDDPRVVEQRGAETGTEVEWDADGTLRIADRRPAIGPHPDHGWPVWFNQIALHHPRYLDAAVREALLGKYGIERLPRNVTFGDGSVIEERDLACVDRAYEAARVEFPWRRGDVLVVDNERVSHARNPFTGERKIIVAMGRMRTPDGILGTSEEDR